MVRFKFSSLRIRFMLLAFIIVMPALGLALSASVEERKYEVARVQQNMLHLIRFFSDSHERLIDLTKELLIALSDHPAVREGDPEVCDKTFAGLLNRHKYYVNFTVIEPDGELLYSYQPVTRPVNVADLAAFQDALRTRNFTVSDYQIGLITGKAQIAIFYPVLNEAGRVEALLGTGLDLSWLNELAVKAGLPEGTTVTVIDRNGTVLSRYPGGEKWTGVTAPEAPIIRQIIDHQGEGTVEAAGVDGTERLYAFRTLSGAEEGANLYIYIGIPATTVYAGANRTLARYLTGIGLVLVLMFATVWVGGDLFLLRRLNRLLAATRRLAAGDFSARTGLPHGVTELSELARAFDKMADTVEFERKRFLKAIEESRQRGEETAALLDGAKSVLKHREFKEAALAIFNSCKGVIGGTSGYVMLVNESRGIYEVPFIDLGGAPCSVALPLPAPVRGIHGVVNRSGKAVYHNDIAGSEWQQFIPEGHIKIDSALYAPITLGKKIVGLLGFANKPGGFTENDARMATAFGELIAIALHNSRTLQSLKDSEELFSKAFNASPNPMTINSLEDGRFINVNESFICAAGYAREEVVGRSVKDLIWWKNPENLLRAVQMLLEQGRFYNLESEYRTKSGEFRLGLFSAELIDLGGRRCVLGVWTDITERKQFEKEMARLDRLNLVGDMAAGIAHEVRNPMTTVRGFLQLLGGKEECKKYKEFFDLMIGELDRTNSIITEFLSLAKNRAVDLKPMGLNQLISALHPLIQVDAILAEKIVELELGDIPDLLLDEKEIRQLILNLVRNGLESMPPKGILVIRTFTEGKTVVLAVQDQGKGIDPAHLEKLGTPFFTTKDTGTGLGLAVCYSIATRHNAAIQVESGAAGTTFFVRFEPPPGP